MKQFGTPRNSLVSPLPFSMDAKNVRFLALSLTHHTKWMVPRFLQFPWRKQGWHNLPLDIRTSTELVDSGQDHENWEMLNGKDDKLWTTNWHAWRDGVIVKVRGESSILIYCLYVIKKQEDTGTKQTVNKNVMLFSGHDTVNTV